ncbi:MAG: cytochrome-c peroxidase [Saprospiraceae bacterium]
MIIASGALLALAALPSFRIAEPDTPEALGEMLFSDPILSSNETQSCASCHIPAFGFADTAAVSLGAEGQRGDRNTPGVTNMSSRPYFFWDGRTASLELQALQPIANPAEMNLPVARALERLRASTRYQAAFRRVYGHAPDSASLSGALAAFIRTLETGNTPFDRWMQGDEAGMSAAAVRGRALFMEKGKCFDCHFGPDFTGDEFRNIGLFNNKNLSDPGRFAICKDSADLGKFKTPGLRNIAVTPPYMHNGMFKTLREVIDYYDNPAHFIPDGINRDTLLAQPLRLTEAEKTDLEAFLLALTDDRFRR